MMKDSSSVDNIEKTLGEQYFRQKPLGNFRAHITILIFGCLLLGIILSSFVWLNTQMYWKFIETATPEDIEKIEIQRIDQNSNGIGEIITVGDEKSISEFVSALKTVEEYQPNHPMPENEVRVKIWLTQRRTIEFECYTLKEKGQTIFVGYLWIKPSVYSFGNGNAKFPAPSFYNWLTKNGIEIQP